MTHGHIEIFLSFLSTKAAFIQVIRSVYQDTGQADIYYFFYLKTVPCTPVSTDPSKVMCCQHLKPHQSLSCQMLYGAVKSKY